jgi:hypothetical protein
MDSNEPLHQDESEFVFRACILEHGTEPDDDYYPQTVLNTYFPRGLAIASVECCIWCETAHSEEWDYSTDY